MTAVDDLIMAERLPTDIRQTVDICYRPLAQDIMALRRRLDRPIVIGICGSQGSGKSTAALFVQAIIGDLSEFKVAILSLDDLYLTREERQQLGNDVHPLLQTRGVPGTHDVELGISVINDLMTAGNNDTTRIPRFDKAQDMPVPDAERSTFRGRADVVIFEGWFMGARPQNEAQLREPVNELEREEDRDGRWRRYVNHRLAGDYQKLFSLNDMLVFLQAPSFECVYNWRAKQEQKLAEKSNGPRIMSDNELRRFIMHYERLTRHILATMPDYADVVFELDDGQKIVGVQNKNATSSTHL